MAEVSPCNLRGPCESSRRRPPRPPRRARVSRDRRGGTAGAGAPVPGTGDRFAPLQEETDVLDHRPKRCFAVFRARHRRVPRPRMEAPRGGQRFQSGSPLQHRRERVDTVSPSNARRPVSISNSTQPNAQMSARLSTVSPGLLGRHVRRGAENDPGLRRVHRDRRRIHDVGARSRWLHRFRQPEVRAPSPCRRRGP